MGALVECRAMSRAHPKAAILAAVRKTHSLSESPGAGFVSRNSEAQAVSINSPYAELEASATALAKALFKDFPGGNGETVSIRPKDLQDPE